MLCATQVVEDFQRLKHLHVENNAQFTHIITKEVCHWCHSSPFTHIISEDLFIYLRDMIYK